MQCHLWHVRTVLTSRARHATLACYKALVKKNPKVSTLRAASLVVPIDWPYRHSSCNIGNVQGKFAFTFSIQFRLALTPDSSQAKIALKAKSEDELLELEAIAKSLNLCARSIQDASVHISLLIFSIIHLTLSRGRTQVEAGSRTVLGIGPGELLC